MSILNSEIKPWHQQPGETDKAYSYFKYFLSLDPATRNLETVGFQFGVGKANIQKMSTRDNWMARAAAYTNFLTSAADSVAVAAEQDIAFNWADWELSNHDKVRGITERLLARCEQMLTLPVQEMKKETDPLMDPRTGEPILDSRGNQVYQTVTVVKPIRFTASDAPRYAEAALILTKYLAETNGIAPLPSLPAPHKPVEEMSVEEREEYIASIRAQQQALVRGEAIDVGGPTQ